MKRTLPIICFFVACEGKEKEQEAVGEELPFAEFTSYDSPIDSILPTELESCSVIAEERCDGGLKQSCELYDTASASWADSVSPMTEQAFWFDRYFDLHHQANGLSMDVDFLHAIPAGTPESEWSKPEHFKRYDGRGDASGWTGTALWGAAARYGVTGTPSDYDRMIEKLESMVFLYEVTNIEGMLARSHFAMLPEGAPEPNGQWGKSIFNFSIGDGTDGSFEFPIDETFYDRLPAYYTDGVELNDGFYSTTPIVQTDTSRDHYARSFPGIMLAYDLLGQGEREDKIRDTLRTEMSCTLNRLKKGRITNLQQNPDLLEGITNYFAGANLNLDENDMEFTSLDTLVFYVMEQPHPDHMDEFDSDCPDGPPTDFDSELEFDASDPLFMAYFAELALREQRQGKVPIVWSMHVSVRASDALLVTQWALNAHYLTGDTRYLDFLENLMDEIDYWGVMNTYGALQLPKWCTSHYGPSITYPSFYNLLARVDSELHPEFWQSMSAVARDEVREKENEPREDPFFGILYNRMSNADIDSDAEDYVAESVDMLATYGMNPDDKLEPDRNYPRNFVDYPDPDVPLEEITPDDPEWSLCEDPVNLMGLEIPPPRIDGVPIRSADPLPLDKRIGGTFLWQMDPWMVKREYGGIGMDVQWPMLGMFTPYWVGRNDGVITEGAGLALAWKSSDESCEN